MSVMKYVFIATRGPFDKADEPWGSIPKPFVSKMMGKLLFQPLAM
jgi:hypothetical protein